MYNYFRLIFIFLSVSNISRLTYSQTFDQLLIYENLVVKYLSSIPGTERRLNAFGNYRYNLLLSYDDNCNRVRNSKYKDYWIRIGLNDSTFKLFTILDTKTGIVDFLKVDYNNYTPVSFLNNDTLVLKLNDKNKYIGCRYSDLAQFPLNNNLEQLLSYIPENNNYNFRFKVNTSLDKMILLNEECLQLLTIYILQPDDFSIINIESSMYFKDWKFLDFFWVDDKHILLFLAKPIERGITYCQKIYNIENDKIIDMTIQDKYYQIDDYYKGYCIVRISKEPSAYIFRLDLINDSIALSIDSVIEVEKELSEPLYELGFVSQSTIARTTNIEAEKGFFSLALNLRGVNFIQFKITPIKPSKN